MKKISVIIPVYNTELYLKDCLESVINQTFKNAEIILVDDGSTDNSGKICDEFAQKYDNIFVIHKENGGASDTRNRGIKAATGDYIHFIDSDDRLAITTAYEDFNNIVEKYDPDIIFSRCVTYSADFSEKLKEQDPYKTNGSFEGDVLNNVLINNYEMTMTSPVNKLFKRSYLLENDLFFTKGIDHEEDEWLPRVISRAQAVYFYNELFYAVRYMRPNSLSETKNESVKARKACSKILIANTGIDYMNKQSLHPETLSLVTNYYWDYLIDACVTYGELNDRQLKLQIVRNLKTNESFFDSYKNLTSKNRKILGVLFKAIGIKATLKIIKIRYGY